MNIQSKCLKMNDILLADNASLFCIFNYHFIYLLNKKKEQLNECEKVLTKKDRGQGVTNLRSQ